MLKKTSYELARGIVFTCFIFVIANI
jgi:hypothetical protein